MAGKRIILNAIEKACPTDTPGLWAHPEDQGARYTDLAYWTGLARLLEDGGFDAVFLPDVLGQYDVYGNSRDTALKQAIQSPINDPAYLLPAMAAVTKHLSFAVTASTSYEHPYALARKMTTLDHLTDGRVGWNIVTSFLTSAARNFGLEGQLSAEERYARGEEYLEVVYKLWEQSWTEGAVVRDPARGVYADPAGVRDIGHIGEHYRVPGIHLGEPSPQRTPVLFQAGASSSGRDFAARHAECVFLNTPTLEATRAIVDDIRRRAASFGRCSEDILFFPKLTVITAPTDAEAEAKHADYLRYSSTEGLLALLGGWSGIDFAVYGPERLLQFAQRGGNRSIVEYINERPEHRWTTEELANLYAFGTSSLHVGSPAVIADAMERFMAETGVDGFNISYLIRPGSIRDFVELVVPELRKRGLVGDYAPGTFRQKLFGRGDRLPEAHPRRNAKIPSGSQ
ncbi:FMN-dependent oxidoreductase, nitrilotriacetate monooxygenase family [Cohnella sp. OV330]|uniref:LLM class flavin-dependent oxidoreductase n=1 Tax=Cohnella sp. OV330 TaxID=1855288 RepID=UPI0008ECB9D3|nr:LLM class flavin-dependent oxidoreductase [Cohnella sp. OV330]SFB02307.1 FMN-dependent oxidoreductase, nitrilotriacetate monooxygenase family [Cohnella sp. OV330]